MKTGFLAIQMVFSFILGIQQISASHLKEHPCVIPMVLPSEVLESPSHSAEVPHRLEVEIRDEHRVLYRENAEKIWQTKRVAFILIGATGLPLPQELYSKKNLSIYLFDDGNLILEPETLESIKGRSVFVSRNVQETKDRLVQLLPGIEKADLDTASEFCSTYLFQRTTSTTLKGTSYELSDYGLVINSNGDWVGRNIQTSGVISGRNEASFLIPKGSIVCWSGSMVQVGGIWHPLVDGQSDSRWVMCDGTQGTPDLRDRFLRGVNNSTEIGVQGGENQVYLEGANMPAHHHSLPNTSTDLWTHNHQFDDKYRLQGVSLAIVSGAVPWGHWADGNRDTTETSSAGSHTHTITGETTYFGSGAPVDIRPPYYSVIFLQSVGSVPPKDVRKNRKNFKDNSTSGSRVIPKVLNRKCIETLKLIPGMDTWISLDYALFPGGPVVHHEVAEQVWWIEEVPFLLLGATGTLLPENIIDRTSVYITCRLEGTDNSSSFWVYPGNDMIRIKPNVSMPHSKLGRTLDGVNASFLSKVTNYQSDHTSSLAVVGTEFFNSSEQVLCNTSGDWVGSDVKATGEISGQNGLDLAVPKGAIVMWNGDQLNGIHPVIDGQPILEWTLCIDQNDGVPNLRDTLVVGQGSEFAMGELGGSNTLTLANNSLPAHSHTLGACTVSYDGVHEHGSSDKSVISSGLGLEVLLWNPGLDLYFEWAHTDTDDCTESHSHSGGETQSIGSGTPVDILPKRHSLVFIMCTGRP